MQGHTHLNRSVRDQIADMKAAGHGMMIRTLGIVRAKAKIGISNIVSSI
jgi:hypothetical protein